MEKREEIVDGNGGIWDYNLLSYQCKQEDYGPYAEPYLTNLQNLTSKELTLAGTDNLVTSNDLNRAEIKIEVDGSDCNGESSSKDSTLSRTCQNIPSASETFVIKTEPSGTVLSEINTQIKVEPDNGMEAGQAESGTEPGENVDTLGNNRVLGTQNKYGNTPQHSLNANPYSSVILAHLQTNLLQTNVQQLPARSYQVGNYPAVYPYNPIFGHQNFDAGRYTLIYNTNGKQLHVGANQNSQRSSFNNRDNCRTNTIGHQRDTSSTAITSQLQNELSMEQQQASIPQHQTKGSIPSGKGKSPTIPKKSGKPCSLQPIKIKIPYHKFYSQRKRLTTFRCLECEEPLTYHKKLLKCLKCSFSTVCEASFATHFKKKHQRSYKSDLRAKQLCFDPSGNQSKLQTKTSTKCDKCGLMYVDSAVPGRKTVQSFHADKNGIQCFFCLKVFYSCKLYKNHLAGCGCKTNIDEEQLYTCKQSADSLFFTPSLVKLFWYHFKELIRNGSIPTRRMHNEVRGKDSLLMPFSFLTVQKAVYQLIMKQQATLGLDQRGEKGHTTETTLTMSSLGLSSPCQPLELTPDGNTLGNLLSSAETTNIEQGSVHLKDEPVDGDAHQSSTQTIRGAKPTNENSQSTNVEQNIQMQYEDTSQIISSHGNLNGSREKIVETINTDDGVVYIKTEPEFGDENNFRSEFTLDTFKATCDRASNHLNTVVNGNSKNLSNVTSHSENISSHEMTHTRSVGVENKELPNEESLRTCSPPSFPGSPAPYIQERAISTQSETVNDSSSQTWMKSLPLGANVLSPQVPIGQNFPGSASQLLSNLIQQHNRSNTQHKHIQSPTTQMAFSQHMVPYIISTNSGVKNQQLILSSEQQAQTGSAVPLEQQAQTGSAVPLEEQTQNGTLSTVPLGQLAHSRKFSTAPLWKPTQTGTLLAVPSGKKVQTWSKSADNRQLAQTAIVSSNMTKLTMSSGLVAEPEVASLPKKCKDIAFSVFEGEKAAEPVQIQQKVSPSQVAEPVVKKGMSLSLSHFHILTGELVNGKIKLTLRLKDTAIDSISTTALSDAKNESSSGTYCISSATVPFSSKPVTQPYNAAVTNENSMKSDINAVVSNTGSKRAKSRTVDIFNRRNRNVSEVNQAYTLASIDKSSKVSDCIYTEAGTPKKLTVPEQASNSKRILAMSGQTYNVVKSSRSMAQLDQTVTAASTSKRKIKSVNSNVTHLGQNYAATITNQNVSLSSQTSSVASTDKKVTQSHQSKTIASMNQNRTLYGQTSIVASTNQAVTITVQTNAVASTNDTVTMSDQTNAVASTNHTVTMSDLTNAVASTNHTVTMSDQTKAVDSTSHTVTMSDQTRDVASTSHTVTISDQTKAVASTSHTVTISDQTEAAASTNLTVTMSDETEAAASTNLNVTMSDETEAAASTNLTVTMSDETEAAASTNSTVTMSDETKAAACTNLTVTMSDETKAAASTNLTVTMSDQTNGVAITTHSVTMSDQTNAAASKNYTVTMGDQTNAVASTNHTVTMSDQTNAAASKNCTVTISDQTNAAASTSHTMTMSDQTNTVASTKPTVTMSDQTNAAASKNCTVTMSDQTNTVASTNPTVTMSDQTNAAASKNCTVTMSDQTNTVANTKPTVTMSDQTNAAVSTNQAVTMLNELNTVASTNQAVTMTDNFVANTNQAMTMSDQMFSFASKSKDVIRSAVVSSYSNLTLSNQTNIVAKTIKNVTKFDHAYMVASTNGNTIMSDRAFIVSHSDKTKNKPINSLSTKVNYSLFSKLSDKKDAVSEAEHTETPCKLGILTSTLKRNICSEEGIVDKGEVGRNGSKKRKLSEEDKGGQEISKYIAEEFKRNDNPSAGDCHAVLEKLLYNESEETSPQSIGHSKSDDVKLSSQKDGNNMEKENTSKQIQSERRLIVTQHLTVLNEKSKSEQSGDENKNEAVQINDRNDQSSDINDQSHDISEQSHDISEQLQNECDQYHDMAAIAQCGNEGNERELCTVSNTKQVTKETKSSMLTQEQSKSLSLGVMSSKDAEITSSKVTEIELSRIIPIMPDVKSTQLVALLQPKDEDMIFSEGIKLVDIVINQDSYSSTRGNIDSHSSLDHQVVDDQSKEASDSDNQSFSENLIDQISSITIDKSKHVKETKNYFKFFNDNTRLQLPLFNIKRKQISETMEKYKHLFVLVNYNSSTVELDITQLQASETTLRTMAQKMYCIPTHLTEYHPYYMMSRLRPTVSKQVEKVLNQSTISVPFMEVPEEIVCKVCQLRFDSLHKYKIHLTLNVSHYKEDCRCLKCGMCFDTETELTLHNQYIHEEDLLTRIDVLKQTDRVIWESDEKWQEYVSERQKKLESLTPTTDVTSILSKRIIWHFDTYGNIVPLLPSGKLKCRFCHKSFWFSCGLLCHMKISHMPKESEIITCHKDNDGSSFDRIANAIFGRKKEKYERMKLEDVTACSYETCVLMKNCGRDNGILISPYKRVIIVSRMPKSMTLFNIYMTSGWQCALCLYQFPDENFVRSLQSHACYSESAVIYIRSPLNLDKPIKDFRIFNFSSSLWVLECKQCTTVVQCRGDSTLYRNHECRVKTVRSMQFPCQGCHEVFDSGYKLNCHMIANHTATQDCVVCHRSYGSFDEYDRHICIPSVRQRKRLKLKQKINAVELEAKRGRPVKGGKKVRRDDIYSLVMLDDYFNCGICNEVFKNSNQNIHNFTNHFDRMKCCRYCEELYFTDLHTCQREKEVKYIERKMLSREDQSQLSRKCNECLCIKHFCKENSFPYRCPDDNCPYCFSYENCLGCVCTICGEIFHRTELCTGHTRNKHLLGVKEQVNKKQRRTKLDSIPRLVKLDDSFQCGICNEVFKNSNQNIHNFTNHFDRMKCCRYCEELYFTDLHTCQREKEVKYIERKKLSREDRSQLSRKCNECLCTKHLCKENRFPYRCPDNNCPFCFSYENCSGCVCTICGEIFHRTELCTGHMRDKHLGVKEQVNKKQRITELDNILVKLDDSFQCGICSEVFKNSNKNLHNFINHFDRMKCCRYCEELYFTDLHTCYREKETKYITRKKLSREDQSQLSRKCNECLCTKHFCKENSFPYRCSDNHCPYCFSYEKCLGCVCTICGEIFHRTNLHDRHKRDVHAFGIKEKVNKEQVTTKNQEGTAQLDLIVKKTPQQRAKSEVTFEMKKRKNENKCDICEEKFNTLRELKKHRATVHHIMKSQRRTVCEKCGLSLYVKSLKKHLLKIHGEDKALCPKKVRSKGIKSQRRTVCEKCGLSLHVNSLKKHLLRMHGEGKVLYKKKVLNKGIKIRRRTVCEKCGISIDVHSLKKHQIQAHGEGRQLYQCHICSKKFVYQKILKHHLSEVHYINTGPSTFKLKEENFLPREVEKCKICGKLFTKSRMYMHMKQKHGDEIYICDKCGLQFISKFKLSCHKNGHHLTDLKSLVDCNICGKTVTKRNLSRHQKIIHFQKKFECTECGKRYYYKHMLIYHIRHIHEGYNPFSCDICNYTCYMLSSLKSHMKYNHQTC